MPIVILTRADVMIAGALGEMRHQVAVEAGYYRQLGATPEEDIASDRVGIMGEIAFGRWGNVFVDFGFEPRKGGWDFLFSGVRVDVKTTKIEGKRPSIDAWKFDRHAYQDVDAFVFAELMKTSAVQVGPEDAPKTIAAPTGGALMNLIGFATKADFKRVAKLVEVGKDRKLYIIEREDLSPLSFLGD